eukprot:2599717-Rhodomonas_salina.1
MPDLPKRLLLWLEFLEEFDFGNIQYLPGAQNPVGDALSRILDSPTTDSPPRKGDIIVSHALLVDIGMATISRIELLANPITRAAAGVPQRPVDRFQALP